MIGWRTRLPSPNLQFGLIEEAWTVPRASPRALKETIAVGSGVNPHYTLARSPAPAKRKISFNHPTDPVRRGCFRIVYNIHRIYVLAFQVIEATRAEPNSFFCGFWWSLVAECISHARLTVALDHSRVFERIPPFLGSTQSAAERGKPFLPHDILGIRCAEQMDAIGCENRRLRFNNVGTRHN